MKDLFKAFTKAFIIVSIMFSLAQIVNIVYTGQLLFGHIRHKLKINFIKGLFHNFSYINIVSHLNDNNLIEV